MEFYGLLGEKLGHSLSPIIHKKIFEKLNIEGAYKLFPIPKEEIHKVGESIKLLGIKGVNVTIPYKQEIMKQLSYISDEAKKIGAVNTVLLKDGELYGYNSDYFGFGKMLEINNIEVKEKIAVVLGYGGAAKAVITYLLDNNVNKLYVVSRDKSPKEGLDSRAILIDYEDIKNIKGDILVNTTPVGMYPNIGKSPVEEDVVNNFSALVDLIYNPKETEFLRLGNLLGKKTCGGLYMLVGQAIKSQEIWQNMSIDEKILNEIYEELNKEFI